MVSRWDWLSRNASAATLIPKRAPKQPPQSPTPTGIDYLNLIEAAHHSELARGINYHALADHGGPDEVTL